MDELREIAAGSGLAEALPAADGSLADRIALKTARAGVVGLGYVGLPLAVEIGAAGYRVVGVDKSEDKIAQLRRGQCYIPDVDARVFEQLLERRRLEAAVDDAALGDCDVVSICVPTPLRKTKDPDLSYVMDAARVVAERLRPGALVILESTTYPGTTEEQVLPLFESGGRRVGRDFHLCFSPERVDPGNSRFKTRDIPKVIGGVTERCTELGQAFYSRVVDRVVPVSSTRVAEMVKLLENTFRMINIGLVNEMAIMCDKMGINVWEVIAAAATKPFGFMPFYPGPGLGGHCIPVDPHYLSWKTRQVGYNPRFIELASEINAQMPQYVYRKIQDALNSAGKALKGSRIHLLGVAYKKDVGDVRESPALDLLALLEQNGASVAFTDPYVPKIRGSAGVLRSQPLEQAYDADCVAILADHSAIDYAAVVERAALIFDARNATAGINRPNIVRL